MEPDQFSCLGTPAAAIAVALLAFSPVAPAAETSGAYVGKSVRIGKGTAHTVVQADANGNPVSIGIVFSETALEGLPPARKRGPPSYAYPLAMPKLGPRTMVDHVVINWEPEGHAPSQVYDVPHFDFHYYLIRNSERMKIKFKNEAESGDPSQQPPPESLPVGYVVPPGTAMPQMGVHAVNPSAPEFHGQPFTATYIYGYYAKKLAFLEPMASLAFLKTKPQFSAPVPRPPEPPKAGSYPSSYSLTYDQANGTYAVTLEGL